MAMGIVNLMPRDKWADGGTYSGLWLLNLGVALDDLKSSYGSVQHLSR